VIGFFVLAVNNFSYSVKAFRILLGKFYCFAILVIGLLLHRKDTKIEQRFQVFYLKIFSI